MQGTLDLLITQDTSSATHAWLGHRPAPSVQVSKDVLQGKSRCPFYSPALHRLGTTRAGFARKMGRIGKQSPRPSFYSLTPDGTKYLAARSKRSGSDFLWLLSWCWILHREAMPCVWLSQITHFACGRFFHKNRAELGPSAKGTPVSFAKTKLTNMSRRGQ